VITAIDCNSKHRDLSIAQIILMEKGTLSHPLLLVTLKSVSEKI